MQRRKFINKLGVGVAVSVLILAITSGIRTASAAKVSRPNVVLIIADDLGYETLGCNGGTSYRTPNLDSLARTGVRFTNCNVNTICTPTRVALMTGRYMFRNYTRFGALPPDEMTFGHMMQDAGYATCVVGKWQLGPIRDGTSPSDAGFDEHFLKLDDNSEGYADPIVYSSDQPEPKKMHGEYGPDLFYEYIADFITRHRTQPFFVYYPMFLTHPAAPDFMPTPDSPEWASGDRREKSKRFFPDMVAYMDKNVGRIVRKLEELDLRKNTLLIFLGDNGTPSQVTSFMGDKKVEGGKGQLTGTNVPLIVSWPSAAPAGQVVADLVDPTDFVSTITEATGAGPRKPPGDGILDGVSFLPAVTGRPGNSRDWIICEYVHEDRKLLADKEGRYARDRKWKLYGKGISKRGYPYFRAGELYDMASDPDEKAAITTAQDTAESAKARKRLQAVLDRHPVPDRMLGPAPSSGATDAFMQDSDYAYQAQDRIGWSADGNRADSDDWGATALSLAIFAKKGKHSHLVHYDYNNNLGGNYDFKAAAMEKSALEGADKFMFDKSKFFNDQTQLNAAINNIAAEINKSSANNRFWYVQAGPFEVAYQGIKKADPSKRQYCILVSHTKHNNNISWAGSHTADDCVALGAKLQMINGQNGLNDAFGGGNTYDWSVVDWMKSSPCAEYRWVWDRLRAGGQGKPVAKRGCLDASDGGMAYWLMTGDEDGNFVKLKYFLGTSWPRPGSGTPTPTPEGS